MITYMDIMPALAWIALGCCIGYLTRSANLRARIGWDEPFHYGGRNHPYTISRVPAWILSAGKTVFRNGDKTVWSYWFIVVNIRFEVLRRG